MNRIPLLLSAVFYIIYKLTSYLTGENWLSLLVFIVPIGLLLVNMSLRKSLRYKSWFLGQGNLLLERNSYSSHSDIPNQLLFDKLLEVLDDSEFKLLDTDKNGPYILAGTSVNFWTWGENVYIRLEETENGETTIHFTSITLFGNKSWKRNQNNFESFFNSLESSLTI